MKTSIVKLVNSNSILKSFQVFFLFQKYMFISRPVIRKVPHSNTITDFTDFRVNVLQRGFCLQRGPFSVFGKSSYSGGFDDSSRNPPLQKNPPLQAPLPNSESVSRRAGKYRVKTSKLTSQNNSNNHQGGISLAQRVGNFGMVYLSHKKYSQIRL